MSDNLKIIIPMAGWGSRLRPHTWSRPKPLISAGDTTVLGHLLSMLHNAPDFDRAELVFVVGHLGEQIEKYMKNYYPSIKTSFVKQEELLGQSHAILMAEQFLSGPVLVVFVDTLVEADFSFLKNETADGVIWVKEVQDPRRFGVITIGKDKYVKKLVEKPKTTINNLAVVGIYYFGDGNFLRTAIKQQINQDIKTAGEFFLADAINIMVDQGAHFKYQKVSLWLDTGLPETVLETNKHMLISGHDNTDIAKKREKDDVHIQFPVYIHPTAEIQHSVIGEYVTIGENCKIFDSIIRDSVVEAGAQIKNSDLKHSLIGERGSVVWVKGAVNLGDDSSVSGEPEEGKEIEKTKID